MQKLLSEIKRLALSCLSAPDKVTQTSLDRCLLNHPAATPTLQMVLNAKNSLPERDQDAREATTSPANCHGRTGRELRPAGIRINDPPAPLAPVSWLTIKQPHQKANCLR